MLQIIETNIHPFAGYLKAVIQKDNNTDWDLSDLINAITTEFNKHNILVNPEESILFLIAYIPHIYPNFYDEIIKEAMPQGGDFPEFGGVRGSDHRGLLPTGETAQFIIAGTDLQKRLQIQQCIINGAFAKSAVLSLEAVKEGEPLMSGRLVLAQEWINRLVSGVETAPKFGPDFPARKITTGMTWDDLVLNPHTQNQLHDILVWVQHNETLMQDQIMKRKIKPGFKALFHGPPGTGKTLTASLLGNHLSKDVYRIDLSLVVSKYIGETEKNLEIVFKKAIGQQWILFFDEADALFGKRTETRTSNDRYANQEVSYLLQRIEDYPGLVILASNLKSNMDDAFLRRFNTIIHFAIPNAEERLTLWQKSIPLSYQPEPGIDLKKLADKYELNGAAILNIIHYAALQAISKNDKYMRLADITEAMRKEYRKEERTMG